MRLSQLMTVGYLVLATCNFARLWMPHCFCSRLHRRGVDSHQGRVLDDFEAAEMIIVQVDTPLHGHDRRLKSTRHK